MVAVRASFYSVILCLCMFTVSTWLRGIYFPNNDSKMLSLGLNNMKNKAWFSSIGPRLCSCVSPNSVPEYKKSSERTALNLRHPQSTPLSLWKSNFPSAAAPGRELRCDTLVAVILQICVNQWSVHALPCLKINSWPNDNNNNNNKSVLSPAFCILFYSHGLTNQLWLQISWVFNRQPGAADSTDRYWGDRKQWRQPLFMTQICHITTVLENNMQHKQQR